MQDFFNNQRFGPPSPVKVTSPCPGLDRLASGLLSQTYRPFGLAFASAPDHEALNLACDNNSPDHSSTGTRSSIPESCPSGIALPLLVNARFQVLFTPRQGFFSPFPRGTGTLSVAREYLALESGLPNFAPNFTCSVLLRYSSRVGSFSFTGLSPSLVGLSRAVQLTNRFLTRRI
jgi:hypothetical protein